MVDGTKVLGTWLPPDVCIESQEGLLGVLPPLGPLIEPVLSLRSFCCPVPDGPLIKRSCCASTQY